MKYLKRSILTLAIAVIPFHSYVNGCGGDYYDYMNYYNLFDQLLLENKGLQPFLLTTDYAFYGEDTNPDAEQQPDVCLSLKGLDTEVTLPNLNSADLPIELVNVVLIVKSKVVLSEEETFHATAVFLAYLQEMQPTLWNKLRKAGNPLGWISAIVKGWAEGSGLDPKSFTSSSSINSITRR